jgi:D-glycero-D-manno-heptose 1,7-bisphosphate phosphatase
MKQAPKRAAVFLDRDGTLIREVNYLSMIAQIEVLPGVAPALQLLRRHGFKLVMVTNQSVVARGGLSEAGLQQIHAEIVNRLAQEGATLDGIYYCPHHPTEGLGDYRILCDCRKPKTGMIKRAGEDLQIDPSRSYVVGDQPTDIELARAVGATGIFVGRDDTVAGEVLSLDFPVVANLAGAAEWIVEHLRESNRGAEPL